MNSGTTFIGLILLLVCIVPIVILTRIRRKREKQFLKSFLSIADKRNCKIAENDLWNNTAIGLDIDEHKIFFFRKTANNEVIREINLAEMLKCRVISTTRASSHKEVNQTVVDKLELAFTSIDKNRADIILEFYSTDYDSYTLTGELQLSEKWSRIANAEIAALNQKKSLV